MVGEESDERPIARPNCHSWRALEKYDYQTFAAEMRELWPECQWARFTVVSPDHPMPPYPDGWYFEGWTVRPEMMEPPHRPSPFDVPLTAGPSDAPKDTPDHE